MRCAYVHIEINIRNMLQAFLLFVHSHMPKKNRV